MLSRQTDLGKILLRTRKRASFVEEFFAGSLALSAVLLISYDLLARLLHLHQVTGNGALIITSVWFFVFKCRGIFPSWRCEFLKVSFNNDVVNFETLHDTNRFRLHKLRWADVGGYIWNTYNLELIERDTGRRWVVPKGLLLDQEDREAVLGRLKRAVADAKLGQPSTTLVDSFVRNRAITSSRPIRYLQPIPTTEADRLLWRSKSLTYYFVALSLLLAGLGADLKFDPKHIAVLVLCPFVAWVAPSLIKILKWTPGARPTREFEYSGRLLVSRLMLNDVEIEHLNYPWFWFKSAEWKGDSLVLTPWVGGEVGIPNSAFESDVDRAFIVDVVNAPLTAKAPIQRA